MTSIIIFNIYICHLFICNRVSRAKGPPLPETSIFAKNAIFVRSKLFNIFYKKFPCQGLGRWGLGPFSRSHWRWAHGQGGRTPYKGCFPLDRQDLVQSHVVCARPISRHHRALYDSNFSGRKAARIHAKIDWGWAQREQDRHRRRRDPSDTS